MVRGWENNPGSVLADRKQANQRMNECCFMRCFVFKKMPADLIPLFQSSKEDGQQREKLNTESCAHTVRYCKQFMAFLFLFCCSSWFVSCWMFLCSFSLFKSRISGYDVSCVEQTLKQIYDFINKTDLTQLLKCKLPRCNSHTHTRKI